MIFTRKENSVLFSVCHNDCGSSTYPYLHPNGQRYTYDAGSAPLLAALRKSSHLLDAILQASKDQILNQAAKEIAHLLKDNLYNKFASTEEFKMAQDQRLAIEQVGDTWEP